MRRRTSDRFASGAELLAKRMHSEQSGQGGPARAGDSVVVELKLGEPGPPGDSCGHASAEVVPTTGSLGRSKRQLPTLPDLTLAASWAKWINRLGRWRADATTNRYQLCKSTAVLHLLRSGIRCGLMLVLGFSCEGRHHLVQCFHRETHSKLHSFEATSRNGTLLGQTVLQAYLQQRPSAVHRNRLRVGHRV